MTNQSCTKYSEPLDIRVVRSLRRHGLDGILVENAGNGVVKLDLSSTDPSDRSLAIAIVRSVPSVRDIRS